MDKIKSIDKIEELIESAEKKVHAGEWLRVNEVRVLMGKLLIWANEGFTKTLNDVKDELLFELSKEIKGVEE